MSLWMAVVWWHVICIPCSCDRGTKGLPKTFKSKSINHQSQLSRLQAKTWQLAGMSDVLHISLHNLHTFERNWKGGREFGTDDLVDKQGFSLHAHMVSKQVFCAPPAISWLLWKTSSSWQLFILTTQKWLKLPCSSSSSSGFASADTPRVRRSSSSSSGGGAVRSCKAITYTNLLTVSVWRPDGYLSSHLRSFPPCFPRSEWEWQRESLCCTGTFSLGMPALLYQLTEKLSG